MMILKGQGRINVMNQGLLALKSVHPAAARILDAALIAADPGLAVTNIERTLEEEGYLENRERISLVAMGKASIPMAQAACDDLGSRIVNGIVVTKSLAGNLEPQRPGLTVLKGSHPVPDETSLTAGEAILAHIERNRDVDCFLFLISGGASSLVTRPAKGLALEDLKKTTSLLLGCGAPIEEINTVRKHLDDVKGGKLAVHASPVLCITLVLSDIPGNLLDMIASGPTVADPTTFDDALAILKKHLLMDTVPTSVKNHLIAGSRGEIPDTPKPGTSAIVNSVVMVVGSLEVSMAAARRAAEQAKYQTEFLTPVLSGEAADQGRKLGRFLAEQAKLAKPGERLCWIGGGETTVNLGNSPTGRGGRNQELALAAVDELAGIKNAALVTFATDGDDGLSPAAGAIVTGEIGKQAAQKGLDAADYLAHHDSFTFFDALGSAIITGPTGTNVNDLVLLLVN
jgi:hydroxypyruvate reductase